MTTTSDSGGFTNLVPGFDFLQGLMKSAGAAVPNIGQWVAPTLDPAELEKRIGELRTVQFWLEQNARLLATTIQALEVQRMTLSTLKTMNVQMGDLRESLKAKVQAGGFGAAAAGKTAGPAPASATSWFAPPVAARAAASPATEPASSTSTSTSDAAVEAASNTAGAATPPSAIDPMQWWGALTKQFTQLAAGAVQDGSAETAKTLAARTLQQSFEAAGDAFRKTLPPGFGGVSMAAKKKPRASGTATKRVTAKRAAGTKAAAKR